jgi:hypothetical protein
VTPTAIAASPTWCDRLIAELNVSDERAKALAATLTRHQLNWKPHPGEWSVGQCLDHLSVSNEVYLPAISEALVGRSQAPVPEISVGWFGRWFIRNYIAPPPPGAVKPRTRAPAPGKIRPSPDVDRSVLDRFLRSNETTRQIIRQACSHDVNRIRFRNPLVGVIRFTVGTGLEIISQHERRHLIQAERIRNSPGFPAPG